MTERIHALVRERYARTALAVVDPPADRCAPTDGCCAVGEGIGPGLYSAVEREGLPDAAVLASLGCGNPVAVADPREGERVLGLGSGGGIDVLLSARRIGPGNRVFGLDMTDAMLALRGSYVGCIAGALSYSEFEAGLRAVGLVDISVTPTHAVAEGMHSAIVRAIKARAAAGEP